MVRAPRPPEDEMVLVERAEATGSRCARWSPSGKASAPDDVFAAVFESARRSVDDSAGAFSRCAGQAEAAQGEKQAEGTSPRATRRASNDRRPGSDRVARMKESAQAEGAETKPEYTRSKPEPRQIARAEAADRPPDPSPEPERAEETQAPDQDTDGAGAATSATSTEIQPVSFFQVFVGFALPVQGQPVATESASQAAIQGNTMNPTPMANSEAIQPVVTIPVTPVTPPDDGAEQPNTGAGQAAHAKPEPGAQNARTVGTFNQLMELVAQRRAGGVMARGAGGPGAQPGVGERIDMSEARAVSELARVVRTQLGGANSRMLLRLDPPELGQVQVEVRMHQQALDLRFQAETAAGQEALRSKLGELRSALEQHGIAVDQMVVEHRPRAPDHPHSPGDQPANPQWHASPDGQASGDQQAGWTGSQADHDEGGGSWLEPGASETMAAMAAASSSTSGVDVTV